MFGDTHNREPSRKWSSFNSAKTERIEKKRRSAGGRFPLRRRRFVLPGFLRGNVLLCLLSRERVFSSLVGQVFLTSRQPSAASALQHDYGGRSGASLHTCAGSKVALLPPLFRDRPRIGQSSGSNRVTSNYLFCCREQTLHSVTQDAQKGGTSHFVDHFMVINPLRITS